MKNMFSVMPAPASYGPARPSKRNYASGKECSFLPIAKCSISTPHIKGMEVIRNKELPSINKQTEQISLLMVVYPAK
jgi:hypothetical protein